MEVYDNYLKSQYGDADKNNVLTAADAATILQKVLDSSFQMPVEETREDYMSVIDVDDNGVLTAADAGIVLQKVLNSLFLMPVETK